MQLTAAQQKLFWNVFTDAWKNHAAANGLDPADRPAQDAYRHQLVFKATGQRSLKDVSRAVGFDRLMLETSRDAERFEVSAQVVMSQGRRTSDRCEDCLRQICEIEGRVGLADTAARWGYVSRMCQHAFRQCSWEDISEDELEKVFQMLDTHRRRLLKAGGWIGGKANPHEPLAYARGRRYGRVGRAVVWQGDGATEGTEGTEGKAVPA